MALDPVTNFGRVTVVGAYDDAATSIQLQAGDGAKLLDPGVDGAFNLIYWNATDYPNPTDDPFREIVRCTGNSGDVLTVTRNQEGSGASAKNIAGRTYKMANGVTAKMITDIGSALATIPTQATIKYLVASSTAPAATKAIADYVCDGTADDVQINAAITAVIAAGGGRVELTEGQFNIIASVSITASNVELIGRGVATHIFVTNSNPCNVVSVTGSGVAKVHVKDMWLDGNKSNNSYGDGIYLYTPWAGTDPHNVFEDILITDCVNNGVEVQHSGDTRITYWNRVHVRNASGNGFYLPWPAQTDSFFTDCVAELCGLNGWYVGTESCWFTNCNSFYNGSIIGLNFGWYIASYNNWFTACQAQDNYIGGWYMQNDGDGTYGTQNNAFINCQADSNNQYALKLYTITVSSANATIGATYTNNGVTFTVAATISGGTVLTCYANNPPTASGTLTKSAGTGDATITFSAFALTRSYGNGMQIINTEGTQIIGGAYFTRPYPSFYQNVGISLEGSTDGTYISGPYCQYNSINYQDLSTGKNYFATGPSGQMWEVDGVLDVRNFGAKGNTQRLFGAVSTSSGQNVVTCSTANFSQSDVGKTALVYKEGFYGNIRTIASVQSATQCTLSGTTGATTTSGNGYFVYGNDDSTIINKVLALASYFCTNGSVNDANQPIGSGRIRVNLPGNSANNMYMIAAQITVPYGVTLNCDAKLANLIPNRNSPCILMNPFTGIDQLELDNLGGTGILAGSGQNQAQIFYNNLKIWHGIGQQSGGTNMVPTSVAATPQTSGGSLADGTYYYVVTAIDSTGGESQVSSEVSSVISGGSGHGETQLSWVAPASGSVVSYRIYRGTATGLENVYYTTSGTSFTDTGAASTANIPTMPGYAIMMTGYEHRIGSIFVKECNIGIYNAVGSDLVCDSAFLIGCANPIRAYGAANQVHYTHVFLDTCGTTSIAASLGGVTVDNGCSNFIIDNLQESTLTGQSRSMTPVVNIGSLGGTQNAYIRIKFSANNAGGTGLQLANAADCDIDMILSNTHYASGVSNAITTGVVYGSNLSNEIRVRAVMSAGITPFTGTMVGTMQLQQGGIEMNLPLGTITSLSALATLSAVPQIVKCSTTSAGFTVTLPTAVGNVGLKYTIKKVTSDANVLTIATTSAQLIDGQSTVTITQEYAAITVISDGFNWNIIA